MIHKDCSISLEIISTKQFKKLYWHLYCEGETALESPKKDKFDKQINKHSIKNKNNKSTNLNGAPIYSNPIHLHSEEKIIVKRKKPNGRMGPFEVGEFQVPRLMVKAPE